MRPLIARVAVLAMLSFAPVAATAQDASTSLVPSLGGFPIGRDAVQAGNNYAVSAHGDWLLRCIRIEEVTDPCEIHQTLLDQDGNRVAEINVFPLPAAPSLDATAPQVSAGATMVTPLETLLTRQVNLSVDGGEGRIYPFSFCNSVGCVAQIGFAGGEIDRMKAGSEGFAVIFPAQSPQTEVRLRLSLTGFTAAYDALLELPQP